MAATRPGSVDPRRGAPAPPSGPLGEQRGRGPAGRTAADDDRIDLCVIARLHDSRPAPGSPVSSAFQIAEGSSRASSSRARATKPLALATAKLMPFKGSRDDDPGDRRLFANHRGHGCAVAEPIDEILVERPIFSNGDALFDGSHVGMRGMNAAVDDCDADPATRVLLQEHVETGDRGPDVSSLGSR